MPRKLAQNTYSASTQRAVRTDLFDSIAELLRTARTNAYRAVNFVMVETYWNIGRMIVEEEQQGKEKAGYGEALLRSLSERLTLEFGKGFNISNLFAFRQFYLAFENSAQCAEFSKGADYAESEDNSSQLVQPTDPTAPVPPRSILRSELSWSHYRLLIRVTKPEARSYYMHEAAEQGWSVRALERQINSLYYERLKMSRDRAPVEAEAQEKTASLAATAADFIKDPYVLEFLNIPDAYPFRESELEQAIIDKLQAFMLELGKGYAFVARQQRISTDTKNFFIDLVFYNFILKCFVLIDLKTGELTHQDIGQMDMYVRLYEDSYKNEGDNPTIGIILCTERDQTVVKYSVLSENRQLFAAKYQLYLPTEQELVDEVEREKAFIIRERGPIYD